MNASTPSQTVNASLGHGLEAYTVVLSITAHLLSTIFGGCSSLAVVLAIATRSNINKCSYSLVLALFLATCGVNFVWSPLEVADLLSFHYHLHHPSLDLVFVKTAVYVFLLIIINVIIVLLSAEGLLRMASCFGPMWRRLWPALSLFLALLFSVVLIAILIARFMASTSQSQTVYALSPHGCRKAVLGYVALVMCTSLITLLVLVAHFLKNNVYWEDGKPHMKQRKMKLALPEFLISQSNACVDGDLGYDNANEVSETPSPSTPQLLMVGSPDTASIKGEDISPIPDLPSPTANKSSGNRLGINMAHVLGRRRHTICQISDSTTTASTQPDPISKAKQYNYVRKFSVDISALQAQLQNPKIFKDAPFQSDVDLSKRSDSVKGANPKALVPLKPLKLEEKADMPRIEVVETLDTPGEGLKIPPPPVIMVSNDESSPQHTPNEVLPKTNGPSTIPTPPTPAQQISTAEKPATLSLNDASPEDPISAQTLESAVTDPSDTESETNKLTRLTLAICLTFVLCTLPVFVTETLRSSMSGKAYDNVSSCVLALSAVQTIVYPHLIASSDDVVHTAVRRLKNRLRRICPCGSDDPQGHVEDSSSTSQV